MNLEAIPVEAVHQYEKDLVRLLGNIQKAKEETLSEQIRALLLEREMLKIELGF